MSALVAATAVTPATVASFGAVQRAAAEKAAAADRWATRVEAAARWATHDKLRRSLEGRLRGAAPQYAAPIERQLKEVKRLLRRDSWAVEK
jgi:hypothetical protein